MSGEKGIASCIGRVKATEEKVELDTWRGFFVGESSPKRLNGAIRITMVQSEQTAEGRKVAEPDRGVLREPALEIFSESLRAGRAADKRKRNSRSVLDVPSLGEFKRFRSPVLCSGLHASCSRGGYSP